MKIGVKVFPSLVSFTLSFAVILASAILGSGPVHAQVWSSNGMNVNPTTGLTIEPSFCYDPDDGLLYLENAGINGEVESQPNMPFGGDDYPMISALISFTGSLSTGDPVATLPVFENGVAWGAPVLFNSKLQLVGTIVANPGGLTISEEPTAIMQLDPGLTADDFGGTVSIETGYSFGTGVGTGGTLFSVGDALASGAFRISCGNAEDQIDSQNSTDMFYQMFEDDPQLMEANDPDVYPSGATVFVPTDAAIALAASNGVTWELEDLIIPDSEMGNPSGSLASDTFGYNDADLNALVPNTGDALMLTAASGRTIELKNGSILLGGAQVVETNFDFANGWTHVIDAVPVTVPEPSAAILAVLATICLGRTLRKRA